MSRRKTEADYHALAAERGFEWIGEPLPVNSKERTRWRCATGNEWSAPYYNIQKGHGCPHCAGRMRKTEADYRALAAEHDIEWTGKLPKSTMHKTEWRCANNHTWQAKFQSIYSGRGCPHCAGKMRKTEEDYHALAQSTDHLWLGKGLPRNVNTKTAWLCPNGHEREASYSALKNGYGCPKCSIRAKLTADDYRQLAQERGLEWIGGSIPKNTNGVTKWRCSSGHEWETRYNAVYANHGCPHCQEFVNSSPVSKPQLALHAMIGGEVNHPVKRYRIDIALLDPVKIAVEYDCWYWHAGKEAHERKRDDYLLRHGWRILHIRSANSLPTPEQLDEALARLRAGEVLITITLDDWKDASSG